MLYTVRYKTVGYHSQCYNYTDINCTTLAEAITNIELRGEIASGTIVIYKKLPKNCNVRCYYDDWNNEYEEIRNKHKVAVFSAEFVSCKYGYGGWFNFDGLKDIKNWKLF